MIEASTMWAMWASVIVVVIGMGGAAIALIASMRTKLDATAQAIPDLYDKINDHEKRISHNEGLSDRGHPRHCAGE